MTAPEERCWFTLDPKAQPVGPYSIADLSGNSLEANCTGPLMFCLPRHRECTLLHYC